jgi:hypothetical protein
MVRSGFVFELPFQHLLCKTLDIAKSTAWPLHSTCGRKIRVSGGQVGTSLLFVFQHVGITVPQKSGCRAEFVPEISNLPAYTGTPRDD